MEQAKLESLIERLSDEPGILGKEKYFNSAVLIALVEQAGEYHFLFQKRSAQVSQAGEVCFPGGKRESIDDSYREAALREAEEELGLTTQMIDIKGRLDTVVAPMGATIDSFVGVCKINSLSQLNINRSEVEEVFTLPVAYFHRHKPDHYQVRLEIQPHYTDSEGEKVTLLPVEELGLPDRYREAWGGKKHDVYVYKTDAGIIWGITAQLIVEFIAKLTDNSTSY